MIDRVYRGEIYYVHETEVTGSEQTGGRPAVIVSNDIGNEHSPIVEVVYLTTQEKKPLPTHVSINSAARPSTALCEQISTVHKSRLGSYVGQALEPEMNSIDKALGISLGLGLTIKSDKLVKKWSEAFEEETPVPEHNKQPQRKVHKIKILDTFADDVLNGKKPFEIRENDRGYQKGDFVAFEVVSKDPYKDCGEHPLNGKEYEITYVLNGWGVENGYVVFGIKEAV